MKLDKMHPFSVFLYFISVIIFTMFLQNPVIIVLSFVCSELLCFYFYPAKQMAKSITSSIFLIAIMAFINSLLVHQGVTVLLFINDIPLTLESMLYGLFLTMMLVSVYCWFKVYNKVITSDKFIFLFSRFTPKISLMLSMSFSFIEKLKTDYIMIKDSEIALGVYTGENVVDKLKSGFRITNILFNMAVESSVERAESMQARGYGLKGRTTFNIYHFKSRDAMLIAETIFSIIAVSVLLALGFGRFGFYPSLSLITLDVGNILLYVFCFLMFSIGIFECIKESILWKISVSKI